MAGTDFIDNFRSTFMGQRDQVKAERAAEKAEAKAQQAAAEASKAQEQAKNSEALVNAQEKIGTFLNALRDAVKEATSDKLKKTIEPTEVIEYTYQPGDSFGQVITDLGLKSDAGLWGENGDVAYYTEQLINQGALDSRGNIPVGTKIVLTPRYAQKTKGAQSTEKVEEPTEMKFTKPSQEAKYPPLQQLVENKPRLS